MNVHGVGQYISIKVNRAGENFGEVCHDVEELGLKSGETVFFNSSDIDATIENEMFSFVRAEDIFGVVRD